VDPDRIAHVVTNLLENALRYSPHGSTVSVESCGLDDAFELTVHNSGHIASDRISHIFEPFERGTSAASAEGTGLGLYVARQLVAAHHGKIEVASDPEHGTMFRVTLPRSVAGVDAVSLIEAPSIH
jgi:signal transduction histidine kinase